MNFKLELTENEVNVILASLSKQPYDQVAQIINKLVSDVNSQVKTDEKEGK
jgi:hypothetical protein